MDVRRLFLANSCCAAHHVLQQGLDDPGQHLTQLLLHLLPHSIDDGLEGDADAEVAINRSTVLALGAPEASHLVATGLRELIGSWRGDRLLLEHRLVQHKYVNVAILQTEDAMRVLHVPLLDTLLLLVAELGNPHSRVMQAS